MYSIYTSASLVKRSILALTQQSKCFAALLVLFSAITTINTVNAQSVSIEKAFASGCYYYSGASKTTISVQVGWAGATSADLITVTLDGSTTRLIHPQSMYDPGTGSAIAGPMVTPQVVAFEINSDAAAHSLVAVMSGAHSATSSTVSVTAPAPCAPAACTGTELGGMVYYDNNADGVHQAGETRGITGVTVTAFDKNGSIYTATSDGYGKYAFSAANSNAIAPANYPIRVEFTNWPAFVQANSGPSTTGNKSSVRFVSSPSCSLDCGGVNPLNYSQANPPVFSNLYTNGNPLGGGNAGTAPALIEHSYTQNTDQAYTTIATNAQVGTVWAKAWNKYNKKLFVAAILKRHSGLGPLGLGGIYALDYSNPASPVLTNFLDVTTLGIDLGQAGVPSNSSRGLSATKTTPNADAAVFGLVGKAGIGNMDLSEDGNTIYFMNLYDRKVYAIDITAYLSSGTIPTASDVSSFSIPDPGCTNGSYHPFALKVYEGKMYVGLVCDGSTGTKSNMVAFIKAMDLTTNTWSDIFDFPLTYPKGYPDQGDGSKTGWYVWSDVITNVWNGSGNILHPVPILSDIEFDLDGTMVLALMDRTCMQMGNFNYDNSTYNGGNFTAAGGDILRAFYSNGAYVLENNAKAGPTTGFFPNNNQGPGFGEFYNDNIDGGVKYHTEMVTGGLTLVPGSGEVMAGMVDPSFYKGGPLWANGPRRLSNTTGNHTGGMAYYSDNGISSFGKAVGMGDLEAAADNISYIEVGNYVWKDANSNGIQDPTESGIAGIVMKLYNSATGALVATDTTDANGNYYFSTLKGDAILPNTGYCVVAGVGQYNAADSTITANGIKYRITLRNIGQGANPDLNDNDFSHTDLSTALGALPAGYPKSCFTAGNVGYINHTIDLGLKQLPGLGDYAWYDADRDGIQDAGELPVQNKKVYLMNCAGDVLDSTTTNSSGFYQFINLEPDTSYKVQFTAPSGYSPTTQNAGSNDSTDSDIDGTTLMSHCVTLGYNEFNPTIDAGFVIGGSLGNYVWFDANGNGVQDEAPGNGINGVTVYLYKDNGSSYDLIDSAVTANSGGNPGYYNFDITSSGNYKVKFPSTTGSSILTTQTTTAGTDGNSDANTSTGFTPVIVMNLAGSGVAVNNPTIDAGYKCVTNAGADQSVCAGNTVQLSGTSPTTGTWVAISTNPIGGTLSSTVAGVATATYTSVANGVFTYAYNLGFCTDTMTVTVVLPMAEIVGTSPICVGNTTTLTNATAGGVWSSSNTAVATVSSGGVVTAIAEGTTVISYKGDSTMVCGCSTKTFNMTVNATPSVAAIAGSSVVCVGSTTTLTNASGGGNWSSSNNAIATINSSGNVTGVAPGSVTISYTATNGCGTDTKTKSITVCNPIAPIVGTTNLCVGGTSSLTDATAGGTWSSSNTAVATVNSSGVVTAVGVGSAIISYTALPGTSCCSNASTATITVSTTPTLAPVMGAGTVCTGQMITVTDASGGGNWSSSDNAIATINSSGNVTGVSAGTVMIIYSTSNACGSTSQTATVTVGGLPISNNTGSSNICVGSTTAMSNATVGGVWSSSNTSVATVDNSGVVTGVAAGNAIISYTVTAGTVCGSNVATTNVNVSVAPTLAPIMGGGVVCVGSIITLTDASGGGNWSSSNNAIATVNSGGNVTGISAGTVTITYTAIYYCGGVANTLTQTATVYVQVPLNNTTGNTNLCIASTSAMSNATAGGTWSSSNTAVATVNSSGVVTGVAAGTAVISYTVTAGSVCGSNVATVNVIVTPTAALAPITGTTTTCAGTMVTLSDASGGGNWSSSNTAVATINSSGNVTAISAGTTTITYSAMTSCGAASQTATFTVSAIPSSPTISGTMAVCNGSTTVLTASSSTGNQWYKNGVAIVGATGHTYTATTTGSYTVTTTNGTACTSAASAAAVVTGGVVTGFTINTNPQDLGGNNFIFTSTTPTTNNTYSWNFGDGTGTTVINPSRSYNAAGTYTVKQIVTNTANGCMDSVSMNVIVTSCCIHGGSTGGVETKSLGDVIAKRTMRDKQNNISANVNYSTMQLASTLNTTVVNGANDGLSLSSLIPTTVSNRGDLTGYISTPTDLISMTNAVEVLAIDYTKNNSCRAVALGMKSLGDVYAHTKPVCDRLKGAELLNTEKVTIDNLNFIKYTLRQCDGTVEYAISFVAGKVAGRNSFSIQSHWMTSNYVQEDTMYNFQVWAADPRVTETVVSDVLNKIKGIMPATEMVTTTLDKPEVYITSGSRNGASLSLNILNATSNTSGYFELKEKATETAQESSRKLPFTIPAFGAATVQLPMSDKYESNVFMYIDNKATDLVYMNDGTWSLDYNKTNTSVQKFVTTNDANINTNANEYPLYRNVEVVANTRTYVSVYKLIKGDCGEMKDLTAFKGIKLNASLLGAGSIKITLAKKGITNWDDQYTYTLELSGNKEYAIGLNSFVSKATTAHINPNDITNIVFSLIGNSSSIKGTLSKVRFTTEDIAYQQSLALKAISIYPNPNSGKFTASFMSEAAQSLVLKVIDLGTGTVVYTKFINATKGINEAKIDVSKLGIVTRNYIVSLEGDGVKYDSKKLVIEGK